MIFSIVNSFSITYYIVLYFTPIYAFVPFNATNIISV